MCGTADQTRTAAQYFRLSGSACDNGEYGAHLSVDTLLLVKNTPPEDIKVGDVISFYSTDPALEGAVNTHRVTAIQQENGEYIYTTRGDANNAEDPYDTPDRYLLGKTVYASVILGKISRLVSNPLIFIPVILIPLAVILISNLVKTISLAKKIAKEEEEEAVKKVLEDLKNGRH